jgi:uncharacterized membrane protein (UPF0127 family)
MRAFGAALLAALFVAVCFAASANAADFTPLSIETASGRHAFQAEVAKDDAMRAQGLMYRRTLDPDKGMLFDFGGEEPVSMWMQNTYVPLDMVFIKADGTVHRVEEHTTPLSTRTIDSGVAVRYVLEVPAGTAAKIGITRGSKVKHKIIGN